VDFHSRHGDKRLIRNAGIKKKNDLTWDRRGRENCRGLTTVGGGKERGRSAGTEGRGGAGFDVVKRAARRLVRGGGKKC